MATPNFRTILRDLRFKTPLRKLSPAFHSYGYMFTPAQLAFLVGCLDETRDVPGVVLEVGCALGKTTLYLDYHMTDTKDARRYVCVDTFSGFVPDDVEVEVGKRNKARELLDGFRVNKKEWFDQNLADNGVTRVTTFESDIKRFDLAAYAPKISFCLLDVDLYQPIQVGLEMIMPLVAPGGIVVVDDCKPNNTFDGALQAYVEYVEKHGLPKEIAHGKLGVIRAPH